MDGARRGRGLSGGWAAWRNRLIASPRFQSWASRFPLTRGHTRREGEAMMDLVGGFVAAQVLQALVSLDVLEDLMEAPRSAEALGKRHGIAPQRMVALLDAGVALRLLERTAGGWRTAARGAALVGVPGLQGMIRHHDVFYRDMADPVALLRGEAETGLAQFWPYVFGAGGAVDPEVTARYSALMEDSQGIVAEETLDAISLRGVRRLMDVGGGTGAFLRAAGRAAPEIALQLFDLPTVAEVARRRFAEEGFAVGAGGRVTITPGSFRDDPLPRGADAISLVRVLYDHDDTTVRGLLSAVLDSLPPGGRVIVSEPMAGAARPNVAGNVYFAFYCMAMRTGRARTPAEISGLLAQAGFTRIQQPATRRPFLTSVVTAQKPAAADEV
ncbi:SAM-dependent methyltransferase [Rhodobaculum claviforme]|uniref:SAM-dependent methyltransferase n=2 Tax=Rhodobaculum claviforme TaxID=1549854 RepID=A0A934WJD5_9RHOB|nr:SAM-dependent methyltransferase [Rhodobaculum claviforme]